MYRSDLRAALRPLAAGAANRVPNARGRRRHVA